MDVTKNRGVSPKMDGENHGKTLSIHGMIWGENPYFWKHPYMDATIKNEGALCFCRRRRCCGGGCCRRKENMLTGAAVLFQGMRSLKDSTCSGAFFLLR